MLDNTYIITIWITIGLTFIFCLFFYILPIPATTYLRNYRIARYIMAFAYLTLGVMNVAELTVQSEIADMQSTKIIALLICLFQSFLFTYTNITLINISFVTKRKILSELTPIIILFITATALLTTNYSPIYVDILFYVFIVYYIFVLVRYTILFRKNHRNYICKMDNFFVDQESKRFRWISISFYAALAIGIMALFTTLFFSILVGFIFSLFIIGFYSYYGIQFINYALLFQYIEEAIVEKEKVAMESKNSITDRNYTMLETNIKKWIADKKFLNRGINIENTALQLNTNRTYLSDYINKRLQKTFKEWISELRIGEARSLMLERHDLSIAEISDIAGFSDISNFGRLFAKHTGMSLKEWRMSKINPEQQIS